MKGFRRFNPFRRKISRQHKGNHKIQTLFNIVSHRTVDNPIFFQSSSHQTTATFRFFLCLFPLALVKIKCFLLHQFHGSCFRWMLEGIIKDLGCRVLVINLLARSLLIETGSGGIRLMIPGISFMSFRMELMLFLAR